METLKNIKQTPIEIICLTANEREMNILVTMLKKIGYKLSPIIPSRTEFSPCYSETHMSIVINITKSESYKDQRLKSQHYWFHDSSPKKNITHIMGDHIFINLLKAKTVKEIAFVNELTKHYFGFLIYQKSILEFL